MRQWIILGLILLLGCAGAEGADVIELEANGTASNNSQATAQVIPPSAFTLPVPETVFDPPGFRTAALFGRGGGPDIDLFRISGHGQLLLDIDNAVLGTFGLADPVLLIFDSSGAALAENDDSGIADGDPGSFSSHESLLHFTLPGPGVYYVGILRFGNWPGCGASCNIDGGWFDSNGPQPDGEFEQPYLLYLSLEHPHRVSVPPTLTFLVSSIGLAVGARFVARRTR